MMAAFSSLDPGKLFLGMKRRGRSPLVNGRLHIISSHSPSTGRRRRTHVEAVLTADVSALGNTTSSPSIFGLQTASSFYCKNAEEKEERRRRRTDPVTPEKLDDWMRESIGEIVRNIGEAPFLLRIFSQGPSLVRVEREEALPESWPIIEKRWDQGCCMPDGVILVKELKDEEEVVGNDNNNNDAHSHGGCSRTWGLVVQGRGMDCAASCYILNTCRVRSAVGFCTHFCLVRAKCFGEPLEKQLSKAWLQGR